jgi:hypothetical protein
MSEPRIKEIRVHYGGGGKVALKDFGKLSSEYSANITRAYEVPGDWTEEQIKIFELETLANIEENLSPILQDEYDARYEIRDWEDEPLRRRQSS